jgi:uncharacterized protein with beta-barrel porin domain
MVAIPSAVNAMNMHVNGNQIILSGDVTVNDANLFADMLGRLRASSGKKIDTLVLRNSNGGAVFSGYAIADLARREGLKTVASGYCISSCSAMHAGGVQRAFADNDQPWMLGKPVSDGVGQFIGLHGLTQSNAYADPTSQKKWYDFFVKAIDTVGRDNFVVKDAFSDHGAAYARLWDPAAGKNPAIYWCHSDCAKPGEYKTYPQDDVYNTSFITERKAVATTDTLVINQNISGNINPNYYNPDNPATGNPITPIAELMNSFGYAWYGGGHFAQASQADIFRKYYNNNPLAAAAGFRSYLLGLYQNDYTSAEIAAFQADPNSTLSKRLAIIDQAGTAPLIDGNAQSIADAYGILALTNGATWSLHQNERAAADTLMIQNGRLLLNGGVLNVVQNYIGNGGVVEGSGYIGQMHSRNPISPTLWFRQGGRLHSTGDLIVAGRPGDGSGENFSTSTINMDDATLALDVTASQHRAPLRFASAIVASDPDKVATQGEYYLYRGGQLFVSPQSTLALNIRPGFYQTGKARPLISAELDTWLAWQRDNDPAASQLLTPAMLADYQKTMAGRSYMFGQFKHLARADAQGQTIAGYDIDPTAADPAKTAFQPFDDSLVSYRLQQNANGVALTTDDAFLGKRAFCNAAGCDVGSTLSHAAEQDASALTPLLGALQFSTNSQAMQARQQIEGAGYAAQRNASLYLLNSFSSALTQHLSAPDRLAERQTGAAVATAMPLKGGNAGQVVDVAGVLSNMEGENNDGAAAGSSAAGSGIKPWGRVFGHDGYLNGQGGQTPMSGWRQDSTGLMLGFDQRLNKDITWGATLGYGTLNLKGSDNGFRGQTKASDGRVYLRYATDQHYLNAFAGATRLSNSATRSVNLESSKLPFSAQAQARSKGTAFSLHLEHGWTVQDQRGWLWQPILPALELVRLPTVDFRDTATDPSIALAVHADKVVDARIGVGLQLAKTFTSNASESTAVASWTPHARILLQHAMNSRVGYFSNSFANAPESGAFAVRGPAVGRDHVHLNVGVVARKAGAWAFLFDYTGDIAARGQDHGVALSARYSW